MTRFTKVDKHEFDQVVHFYRYDLKKHLVTIGEPPVILYEWIGSGNVFGKIDLDWLGPDGQHESYQGEFWEYYVVTDSK